MKMLIWTCNWGISPIPHEGLLTHRTTWWMDDVCLFVIGFQLSCFRSQFKPAGLYKHKSWNWQYLCLIFCKRRQFPPAISDRLSSICVLMSLVILRACRRVWTRHKGIFTLSVNLSKLWCIARFIYIFPQEWFWVQDPHLKASILAW